VYYQVMDGLARAWGVEGVRVGRGVGGGGYLVCAGVAMMRAVAIRIVVVVLLPQRYGLVPKLQDGYVEIPHLGAHHPIPPAPLRYDLPGGHSCQVRIFDSVDSFGGGGGEAPFYSR